MSLRNLTVIFGYLNDQNKIVNYFKTVPRVAAVVAAAVRGEAVGILKNPTKWRKIGKNSI